MDDVAHFSYRGTDDPDCQICLLLPERVKIGYVRRAGRRWAYRMEETQLWSYGPKLKHEAGEALLEVRRTLVRDEG